jgi:signal transduction histidine kinase
MAHVKLATLGGRIARVQVAVTCGSLALIVVGTTLAVDALLIHRTDRQLQYLLTRVLPYLETTPAGALDWDFLRAELDEVLPSATRLEVRAAHGGTALAVGASMALGLPSDGCSNAGVLRRCGLRGRAFDVLAAHDRSEDLALRDQLLLALVLIAMLTAALVVGIGLRISGRAVRPLSELAERVRMLEPGSGERLGVRAELHEVDALAQRFDELVERFEQALAREKRFTAHASHELRTPLTLARAEVETLTRSDSEPDPSNIMRALAALDRLGTLVEALLWFARAQSRLDDESMELVNLADLVRAQISQLARDAGRERFVQRLPDEALVRGDETLLGRAVANLLDNAIKYGDASPVQIGLEQVGAEVVLSVVNGGAALAGDAVEQVFVPFVRLGGSRAVPGGFGLGLPFARAVARAHGGDVEIQLERSAGTEVRLRLASVAWSDTCA